jgi:uncharacterized protein YbcI
MSVPGPRSRFVSQDLANGTVRWYHQHFGRGPTQAKAYVEDEYALIVLGGVQSQAEHTLVEQGELRTVENLRRTIKNAYRPQLCALVEEITGRRVRMMLYDHRPEADASAMIFLFEQRAEAGGVDGP